jgi:hypothetical protein
MRLRGRAYTRYQRKRMIRRRIRRQSGAQHRRYYGKRKLCHGLPRPLWVDKPGKLARHSYRYRCACERCAETRHAHIRRRWKRAAWREIEQAWRDCDECLREVRLFGRKWNTARWPPSRAAIMFER